MSGTALASSMAHLFFLRRVERSKSVEHLMFFSFYTQKEKKRNRV
jgi:hypothetical protein